MNTEREELLLRAKAQVELQRRNPQYKIDANLKKYCPLIPSLKQKEFLDLRNTYEVLYGGAAGGGKLLSLRTPIPTPFGWTTMGSIKVGDELFDDIGTIQVVLAKSEIEKPKCYSILFSDGSEIAAGAEHLWKTETSSTELQIRTTEQIANSIELQHAIKCCDPIKLPDKELPIDPYIFGLWLGDGDKTGLGYTVDDKDAPELIGAFNAAGWKTTKHKYKYHWGISKFITIIKANNLYKNKHIPPEYLRASIEQRLELVRGLMDTDGTVEEGGVSFTNTNKLIIDGMLELLLSLGIKANACEGIAKLNGKDYGLVWDIKFNTEFKVFKLKRKLIQQKRTGFRGVHNKRYIIACTEIPPIPMQCIQVSGSGMFLCGKQFIATHNSAALLMAALEYVHIPSYSSIIFRRSYADLMLPGALIDMSKRWFSQTDAEFRSENHVWRFPSGATIAFGHLDNLWDELKYQGSEYQALLFDEATQINPEQYIYLHSRLRRLVTTDIPLRVRAATNPGGIYHEFYKGRFINDPEDRLFIPAKLVDNPAIDPVSYAKSLSQLDPIRRAQLENGEWIEDSTGMVYHRYSDELIIDALPGEAGSAWYYMLGLDFGVNDASAMTAVGWRQHDPVLYVIHNEKHEGWAPTAIANRIRELSLRYRFQKIVGDSGGIGKAYIEEARQRWLIPIDPAEKANKRGYQELINGDLHNGRILFLRATTLALRKELKELCWKNAKRTEEHPSMQNNACDSFLYIWREARNYREQPAKTAIPYGTPEYIKQQIDRYMSKRQRQRNRKDEW
jgi:ribosome modulation factor